jgi:predicted membrane metal-binding protein
MTMIAHRKTVRGSERSFGLTFAAVFALIGMWPSIFRGEMPHWWALAISVAMLMAGLLLPRLLVPLNIIWFKFGLLLHRIVTPVLMTLIYYLAIVPTGLVLKVAGKDLLRLSWDHRATSYWLVREPPGTMVKQF